ncbi:hypothetical protein GCM10008171_21030 [Methylopila jiangsuensis]|uniref:[acyl-carrier-protein] S-malonyltransferase n=1 Tax=Methylopila jiangsuensis TaxID=586230 RepID=A0A9W6JJE9_9HYPH|nr:acyltransferase domain-containing protein [Methylopila jiangsuensis]MDR6286803.1 trans-AT polyketide synthase/acyltransferase/oxidoreductase domain-containing protein [Methylopila jiangsuensis]GLK76849.1 hypothetical protein GCM10008171_21030 [Methylopila jiangsuensis]
MRAALFSGQGAQRRGMGGELFARFPDQVRIADRTLGYSVAELCLEDPRDELSRTAFTQPAIYVVSVLAYLQDADVHGAPAFVAGHSVGEYAALTAAGVFDFETGLRLVQRRAALMARADGGGLTAVVGASPAEVEEMLRLPELAELEAANFNTPTQTVVGGPRAALERLERRCAEMGRRAVRLNVSGAFHTGAMRTAAAAFADVVRLVPFAPPRIPVALNLTGELHAGEDLRDVLSRHIASPVRWSGCVGALLRAGASVFVEFPGAGVLSRMTEEIRRTAPPAARRAEGPLGRPLVAGSLGRGMAGPEMVGALARADVTAFLDGEGVPDDRLEAELQELLRDPALAPRVGASLALTLRRDDERRRADLFIRVGVQNLELRGYERPSDAVRRYRASASDGRARRLFVRTDRPEAVDGFLDAEAEDGRPFVAAICVEAGLWRAQEGNPEAALRRAVERRAAARRLGRPEGGVLIGAAARIDDPRAAEEAFAAGCDFVAAGAVMLLADEARLDGDVRAAARDAGAGRVALCPDGWLPGLATQTLAWSPDETSVAELRRLQALYLRAPTERRGDRATLREAMTDLAGRLIPCDPAFDAARAWIAAEATKGPLSAARIAHMLLTPFLAGRPNEGGRP